MEFLHVTEGALAATADVVAFCVFGDPSKDAGFKLFNGAVAGHLAEHAQAEAFEGKPQQILVFVNRDERVKARRIVAIGAGARTDFSLTSLRDLAASAAAAANRVNAKTVAFVLPAVGAGKDLQALQLVVEGVLEGSYKFHKYQTSEDAKKAHSVQTFGILTDVKGAKKPNAAQQRAIKAAIDRGAAVASAVNKARDLINEPAAHMTPVQLAAEAQAIAKKHDSLSVEILGPKECAKLGMNMFLAVGQGSDQEPRLVHLTYKPKKKAKKKVVIIGKGVTFDSGGYSLKPSQSMEDMKVDMSGGAAVISAMDAIATLGSEHEVHAICAACENLVSGRAYKLGDVLRSMDGTTVEINNTDAEGRLTLGDAITYARTKIQPDEIYDFATLTGACMVALGPYTAGVFSDNDQLAKSLLQSAERAGEDMWRMPMLPRLREQLKSNIADMRNTGDRFGGAITAALFLKTFAKDTPWVHVDIAGPASVSTARPSVPRGGTGFAVATLVEHLTQH
jgi:leucyl aminopeptidase